MRIMVMDSGRGHTPELIAEVSDKLGLHSEDELVWVAYQATPELLPVAEHVVTGGRLIRPVPQHRPVLNPGAPKSADEAASSGPAEAPDSKGTPGSLKTALRDPERLKAAAAWRLNKVKIVARDSVRSGKGAAMRYVKGHDTITGRALGSVLNNVSFGPGARFGLVASRSDDVLAIAASVDVIVAYDTRSQQAAWLIARKVPGPAVVAGVNAGRQALADAREAAAR